MIGITPNGKDLFYEVELITVKPGVRYQIKLDGLPPLPANPTRSWIVLHTEDGQPELQLRVSSEGLRTTKSDPK